MANVFDQFDQPQSAGNVFDQFDAPKQADPQIGNPQELTFAERYIAPLLDKVGVGSIAGGNVKGSVAGRAFQGAADPGTAIIQLAANALPGDSGKQFNQAVQNNEQAYQQARGDAGSTGFDPARMVGNAAVTLPVAGIGAAAPEASLLRTVASGAAQGAGFGALAPVTDGGDNFWKEKLKQAGLGAITGAGTSAVLGALARVVSPRASVNPDVQLLKDAGVQPTIGQTLGGAANAAEEKLQSVPIVGDAVRSARGQALQDFNEAAINRATSPIGVSVKGAGQDSIAQAGDALSNAYETALSKVSHVNFDTPQFNQQFGQLQNMAQGLSEPMAQKFQSTVDNVVLRKMSQNGSILGSDLKSVDSELGQVARRYGRSAVASEQEFGDAVKQLQSLVRGQVASSNPEYAAAQKLADTGWANLVRVEDAGKRAVNNDGVFTPGQLNMAVRSTDNSVRGRAVARGEALMQDLASAGQNVLGNKVPNSYSTDRALLFANLVTGGAMIPAELAGAAAYTKPVQNALVGMVSSRPSGAPAMANYLRRLVRPATGLVVAGRSQ